MKIDRILELNNKLQREGQELLEELSILEWLPNFGKVDIGGSFIYGTMVDRDIDIAVLTPKLTIIDRSKYLERVSSIARVSRLSMVDYVNHPREDRGKTIWIGLTVPFKGNVWNIDLTIAKPNSPDVHSNMDLHKRMLQLNPADRELILELKYKSLQKGKKEKGVTSSAIYKKVLGVEA